MEYHVGIDSPICWEQDPSDDPRNEQDDQEIHPPIHHHTHLCHKLVVYSCMELDHRQLEEPDDADEGHEAPQNEDNMQRLNPVCEQGPGTVEINEEQAAAGNGWWIWWWNGRCWGCGKAPYLFC